MGLSPLATLLDLPLTTIAIFKDKSTMNYKSAGTIVIDSGAPFSPVHGIVSFMHVRVKMTYLYNIPHTFRVHALAVL